MEICIRSPDFFNLLLSSHSVQEQSPINTTPLAMMQEPQEVVEETVTIEEDPGTPTSHVSVVTSDDGTTRRTETKVRQKTVPCLLFTDSKQNVYWFRFFKDLNLKIVEKKKMKSAFGLWLLHRYLLERHLRRVALLHSKDHCQLIPRNLTKYIIHFNLYSNYGFGLLLPRNTLPLPDSHS